MGLGRGGDEQSADNLRVGLPLTVRGRRGESNWSGKSTASNGRERGTSCHDIFCPIPVLSVLYRLSLTSNEARRVFPDVTSSNIDMCAEANLLNAKSWLLMSCALNSGKPQLSMQHAMGGWNAERDEEEPGATIIRSNRLRTDISPHALAAIARSTEPTWLDCHRGRSLKHDGHSLLTLHFLSA